MASFGYEFVSFIIFFLFFLFCYLFLFCFVLFFTQCREQRSVIYQRSKSLMNYVVVDCAETMISRPIISMPVIHCAWGLNIIRQCRALIFRYHQKCLWGGADFGNIGVGEGGYPLENLSVLTHLQTALILVYFLWLIVLSFSRLLLFVFLSPAYSVKRIEIAYLICPPPPYKN